MTLRVEFDEVATERVLLQLSSSPDPSSTSKALESVQALLDDDPEVGIEGSEGLWRLARHGLIVLYSVDFDAHAVQVDSVQRSS